MAASAAISSVVSVSPKTPKSSLTCESFELPVTGNTPCWITHLRATCAVDAPLDASLDDLAYRGADPGILGPLLNAFGLSGRLDAVPHRTTP